MHIKNIQYIHNNLVPRHLASYGPTDLQTVSVLVLISPDFTFSSITLKV